MGPYMIQSIGKNEYGSGYGRKSGSEYSCTIERVVGQNMIKRLSQNMIKSMGRIVITIVCQNMKKRVGQNMIERVGQNIIKMRQY